MDVVIGYFVAIVGLIVMGVILFKMWSDHA